jgi:hypothetical protein
MLEFSESGRSQNDHRATRFSSNSVSKSPKFLSSALPTLHVASPDDVCLRGHSIAQWRHQFEMWAESIADSPTRVAIVISGAGFALLSLANAAPDRHHRGQTFWQRGRIVIIPVPTSLHRSAVAARPDRCLRRHSGDRHHEKHHYRLRQCQDCEIGRRAR